MTVEAGPFWERSVMDVTGFAGIEAELDTFRVDPVLNQRRVTIAGRIDGLLDCGIIAGDVAYRPGDRGAGQQCSRQDGQANCTGLSYVHAHGSLPASNHGNPCSGRSVEDSTMRSATQGAWLRSGACQVPCAPARPDSVPVGRGTRRAGGGFPLRVSLLFDQAKHCAKSKVVGGVGGGRAEAEFAARGLVKR